MALPALSDFQEWANQESQGSLGPRAPWESQVLQVSLGHKAPLGYQGFKDLLGYLELENQVRMGSLASQDFQVAKGNKDCPGCQGPPAFQGLGNQASQDPKATGALGAFLGLWDQEGRKDQWVPLEWGVPQESQACLESQVLWALQVLLVFLDLKEKVGL